MYIINEMRKHFLSLLRRVKFLLHWHDQYKSNTTMHAMLGESGPVATLYRKSESATRYAARVFFFNSL